MSCSCCWSSIVMHRRGIVCLLAILLLLQRSALARNVPAPTANDDHRGAGRSDAEIRASPDLELVPTSQLNHNSNDSHQKPSTLVPFGKSDNPAILPSDSHPASLLPSSSPSLPPVLEQRQQADLSTSTVPVTTPNIPATSKAKRRRKKKCQSQCRSTFFFKCKRGKFIRTSKRCELPCTFHFWVYAHRQDRVCVCKKGRKFCSCHTCINGRMKYVNLPRTRTPY